MAEIKIEKKKKPVWPWILALLVIAAIIIWIWTDNDDRDDEHEATTTEQTATRNDTDRMRERERGDQQQRETAAATGGVSAYASFVQSKGDSMGLEHRYTHQGITRLANAISAMSDQLQTDVDVQQEVEQLKQQGDELKKNTYSDQHANIIREAFITASNSIERMQKDNFSDMRQDAQDLKQAAEQVKKDELALDQEKEVNAFFRKSADVLRKMSQNTNA